MFSGDTVTFAWSHETNAVSYQLWLGTTPGAQDIASVTTSNLTTTISGLPTNGSQIYATLSGTVDGTTYTVQDTAIYIAYTIQGVITTPTPGSTFPGTTVTFNWVAGAGSSAYWLDAGSTPFGNDYYQSGNLGNVLTATVNGLPSDGSTVYVTLWSFAGGVWENNTYTYTAYSNGSLKGVITAPAPGSPLSGSRVTFNWTAGTSSTAYWLDAGNVAGGNNYYQSGNLGNVLTTTASGLPTDGSTVYVTLWSLVNGQWLNNQYTYTAYNLGSQTGVITSPVPGSTLTGSTVVFTWTAGTGATAYWLDAGSTPGGNQYYQSGNLGNVLTTTATNLPTDGSTVYVTLYSLVGGQWLSNAYTYTAYNNASGKGVITIPTPGSTFTDTTVTFDWTAGAGASAYWLDIGSSPGGNQYYQSGNLGNVLTATVSGLPSDGSTVYVTLYSLVGGQWLSNSYTYTAFTPIVTLGVMQTPIPGSTLSGNTATFTWSAGVGATAYWLEVGSSPGGNQYYQSGNLGNVLTTTTYTLPQNGSTVYATLYSYIGGQWLSNSYTYGSAMAFQGFETDIGDWQPITTRVASGGGVLGVSSASGSYHAELTNVYDTYGTGYGGAEYSLFGYATQPPYPGDFSQSISMYIDKNWPTASPNGNGVGVWIDMSPGNPDPNNYGTEHNFRFTPSGTAVAVSVDGQGSPIATITTSGWYKFQMTYQKGALPTDLVITNMNVFDSTGHLVGTTTVLANSPGGPLLSENLLGPGYVWITVWADGWPAAGANDVLAIDDVRTDLL